MRPLHKSLLVAGLHLAIVCSLGAKLLYDRATRPRVWAQTVPYDPDMPIRGRYVSLQLMVSAPEIQPPKFEKEDQEWQRQSWRQRVDLHADGERLVAQPVGAPIPYWYGDACCVVGFRTTVNGEVAVLSPPVVFFIPEHVPDPSVRQPDEELWVEVTLPRKGPPRPIRLGVKKNGQITPLDLD